MRHLFCALTLVCALSMSGYAQGNLGYCEDLSLAASEFTLNPSKDNNLTFTVNYSGASSPGIVNPVVDFDLDNSSYIDFPSLPYTASRILGASSELVVTTPVRYLQSDIPNGTTIMGDLKIYKPKPTPPYFIFICLIPVSFEFDATSGVMDHVVRSPISVYPNPSDGNVRVQGSSIDNLDVYTLLGERLDVSITKTPDGAFIDMGHPYRGVFILRGKDRDGNWFVRRILM